MLNKYCAYPDTYEILRKYARENRQNMTLAESTLWEYIRGDKLGFKFLRQHIIGDYIVDFVCREQGLIIEVDGAYHAEPNQQREDDVRQHWLERQGYHVLRFTNEEVLEEIDYVLDTISAYFD